MSDKYQEIRHREYAKLALINAKMDRKHKCTMRFLLITSIILFIALGCVLYNY